MKTNRFSFSQISRRDLLRAGMSGVVRDRGRARFRVPVFGQAAAALAAQGRVRTARFSSCWNSPAATTD